MKTTVTLPDGLVARAEAAAKRLRVSRSELYAMAIAEFLKEHHPAARDVTERLDQVYSKEDSRLDPVLHELQLRSFADHDHYSAPRRDRERVGTLLAEGAKARVKRDAAVAAGHFCSRNKRGRASTRA